MIRTNRSNPCDMVAHHAGTYVLVRLVYGRATLLIDVSDLRADGGRAEIEAAVAQRSSAAEEDAGA